MSKTSTPSASAVARATKSGAAKRTRVATPAAKVEVAKPRKRGAHIEQAKIAREQAMLERLASGKSTKRTSLNTRAADAPSHLKGFDHWIEEPECKILVGDCREMLPRFEEVRAGSVDMVFADPPFNWNRAYDKWNDAMPREDYLQFTYAWLDLCRGALRPGGAMWVNIPDDTAAEIVVHLKNPSANGKHPAFEMVNWCVWHYRFGQNTRTRFINSKVHALYFVKPEDPALGERGLRTWNADRVLEPSDRATTYNDPRTLSKKDGLPAGMRVPMDVWYGPYWGRIQGNNAERRENHDNQLPEIYLTRVIEATSRVGDLVLDPFVGSGTTAVVANATGRRFIGTEFSRANAKSAFDRIVAGPARPIGEGLNASTAIFESRAKGKSKAVKSSR